MRRERGDTLVEVLVATAILGAAVVGGLGLMNYGFGLILNSIERTQVQASVNSQLSLVQYARDAYIRADRKTDAGGGAAVWQNILDNASTTYSEKVCKDAGVPDVDSSQHPFYINDIGTAYVDGTGVPSPTTSVATNGKGLWVEAVKTTSGDVTKPNYVDIYVKACWPPTAGTVNQQSRSTLRLYVP